MGYLGGGGGTDERTTLLRRSLPPPSSPYPFLSLRTLQGHCPGARHSFKKKPSALSLSLAPKGTAPGMHFVDFEFQGPGGDSDGRWGAGEEGLATVAGAQPVTFSVDAQAPMVEPELTEVGELHSLTDWQVSEASEEAELDEFCSREGPHATKSNRKSKQEDGVGKCTHRERDRHIHRRGKDERSRGLGLFFPLCQSCTHTEAFKPSKSSMRHLPDGQPLRTLMCVCV